MAKRKQGPQPTRYEIETFRQIGSWEMGQLQSKEPTCFNCRVSFRKWRVTAELIEEPVKVIAARILALWRNSDNYHDREPLRNAAKKIGLDLNNEEFGIDYRRKKKATTAGQPARGG